MIEHIDINSTILGSYILSKKHNKINLDLNGYTFLS